MDNRTLYTAIGHLKKKNDPVPGAPLHLRRQSGSGTADQSSIH